MNASGGFSSEQLSPDANSFPAIYEAAILYAADYYDTARETLEKMTVDHKGTPWEVLAKMHKHVSLGLEWKLEIEVKKEEEKMEMKKE